MVYEDLIKNLAVTTTTTEPPTFTPDPNIKSPVAPTGLIWTQNSKLSNSLSSMASGITDFTIVNPYKHYIDGSNISFDPTTLLQLATERFNIYSSQYRNSGVK